MTHQEIEKNEVIERYVRAATDHVLTLLKGLQRALLDLAEKHADTVMPGFTHLQVAQPVSFAHHLLAYVEMLSRDAQRFADCRKRINRLPLGAAALAGTSFPIDRLMVAKELGFDGVCENSLDAVSDRDFAASTVLRSARDFVRCGEHGHPRAARDGGQGAPAPTGIGSRASVCPGY